MLHVPVRKFSPAILVLLIGTGPAVDASENPFIKNGFPAGRETQSIFPYEHVDPASGALVLAVTDLVLPGNAGFGLAVQHTYNSEIHPGFGDGDVDLEERSWVGLGWRLHIGRAVDPDGAVRVGPVRPHDPACDWPTRFRIG